MSTMETHGPEVKRLISRIGKAGFGTTFVRGLIPEWWSAEVEAEPGTMTELKVRLARRLGIELRSLLAEGPLALTALPGVRFKRSIRVQESAVSEPFLAYCAALAGNIAACMPRPSRAPEHDASDERSAILSDEAVKWISLNALLRRCWTETNIAVVHVVNPSRIARGFDAATFRIDSASVVILAKKPPHSAWSSFVLGHEMGHLALGHVGEGEALVDSLDEDAPDDTEERAANRYALTLLGGAELEAVRVDGEPNSVSLAQTAMAVGRSLRIDPGHMVLRYGRESGDWEVTQAALKRMPEKVGPVELVNSIAARFLDFTRVGADTRAGIVEALGIGR